MEEEKYPQTQEDLVLDAKAYDIEKRTIDVPGMPWKTTEYSIRYKKKEAGDEKEAEVVLNSLMKYISGSVKYKSLEVLSVETDFKWNNILCDKIKYDVGAISIDQEFFKVGDVVEMECRKSPSDKSITHLSTHQMIQNKHQIPHIPNIYLVILKNDTSIKIKAEVVFKRTGPYTKCFVNTNDTLIVRVQNNFDLDQIWDQ